MRHLTILTASFMAVLLAASSSQAQFKKYDIKSGIITFEVVMEDVGTSKEVLSFDDYGMKECEDKYENGKLKESFFSDGKDLYSTMYGQKTTYKRGSASRGTALRFDWDEVSAKDKKSGKAKQIPAMTVAGKKCEAFQLESGATKSVFAGWKHITLYQLTSSKFMKVTKKAVSVEENVTIPADKFAPPKGFAVQ